MTLALDPATLPLLPRGKESEGLAGDGRDLDELMQFVHGTTRMSTAVPPQPPRPTGSQQQPRSWRTHPCDHDAGHRGRQQHARITWMPSRFQAKPEVPYRTDRYCKMRPRKWPREQPW
jgi:hypothetical protein